MTRKEKALQYLEIVVHERSCTEEAQDCFETGSQDEIKEERKKWGDESKIVDWIVKQIKAVK